MIITAVALVLLVLEVTFYGARPTVLTTILTLLTAPWALRLDERR